MAAPKEIPQIIDVPGYMLDMTPDDEFPIRVLEAAKATANIRWSVGGMPEDDTRRFYDLMNESQRLRQVALDRAIAILKRSKGKINANDSR